MVHSRPKTRSIPSASVFNYSYVVLTILLLLTTGATLAYHRYSTVLEGDSGTRWTPVIFLIGFCVSLVIFGMTQREASARRRLRQKTLDLIEAQKENRSLLAAEQESRIAAEKASIAKDEFLAVVSHELRTPLNAIAGWNRILKSRGISDETRATAVERIDKNIQTQIGIVEQILSFSDVMSSDPVLTGDRVPVRDLFEDAVGAVSVAAFQKGVTLTSENELDGVFARGDRVRLKIALVNVLANAVKFTPSGGTIEARAFTKEEEITCVVSDSGLGISPEFLPFVFDRYSQSEDASTRRFGGLGLGLTIAEHIVKQHNGTIEAYSPGLGAGAAFTISLPVDPSA